MLLQNRRYQNIFSILNLIYRKSKIFLYEKKGHIFILKFWLVIKRFKIRELLYRRILCFYIILLVIKNRLWKEINLSE